MFEGFADEGVAFSFLFQVTDAARAPAQADAAPTYRVYGQNGLLASGTGSASAAEGGVVSAATNAAPILITTTTPHGVTTGQPVTISGVGGNTAANGGWLATYLSPTIFSLQGSVGNDTYTSGGAWTSTGLYRITLSGAVLSSLEAGKTYTVVVTYDVESATYSETFTFTVR